MSSEKSMTTSTSQQDVERAPVEAETAVTEA